MSASVDRLCTLVGLAKGYWNIRGQWQEPSTEDRAGVLRALGWETIDDGTIDAEIAKYERARWKTALPATAVIAENEPFALSIILTEGETPAWRIVTESDETTMGSTAESAIEATQEIDGKNLVKRRVNFPGVPAGYHRLLLDGSDNLTLLIAVPQRCHLPPRLENGGRVWGLSVQLYSVRSNRNWGIGDYSDLAALGKLAGEAGADIIGINPLHARSLIRPEECSPYSPVSRLAIDTLAIDPEAIPEFSLSKPARDLVASAGFRMMLRGLRDQPYVDYPGVARAKLPVLRMVYAAFLEAATPERRAALEHFNATGGEAILRYAQFEALRAYHDERVGRQDWWNWPQEPQRNAPEIADEVGFQFWLQFTANEQVSLASKAAHDAGMAIGIYCDLAVGAARDGAEAWSSPALASPLSIGAPPDPLAPQGQNWGIPAPNPLALNSLGFAPFTALLRANMRHAGALRIDHAMALARLFVIPPGKTGEAGSYLAYPFEAMSGILALESSRQRCIIVGEDLGTVPEGFREAMAARAVLSYRVVYFERYQDGAFRAPADFPDLSLATAATHDMPPLAGLWTGRDIEIATGLGIIQDQPAATKDRLDERQRLLTLFEWQKVMPDPKPDPAQPASSASAVSDALHRLVGGSASKIGMVQLDDILGETEPVNVPGTSVEYPNWKRKLSLPLDDETFLERFHHTAALMRSARPR